MSAISMKWLRAGAVHGAEGSRVGRIWRQRPQFLDWFLAFADGNFFPSSQLGLYPELSEGAAADDPALPARLLSHRRKIHAQGSSQTAHPTTNQNRAVGASAAGSASEALVGPR